MENKAYWANRFKILENSTYTDTKKAYEEITKVFDKSKKDIQSKIDVWLTRLADNNNVSYEKAKEMLNKKELKEFKWDVEDYIKYGEENGLNQEWMKELENASVRHHIDKLTALKTSLQAEYEKIYGKDEEITKKTIENAYVNRYNHTAYEIQKGFNIGFNLGEIDHNKLDKLIKKPWASDGSNFSDRIWTKKSQMVDTLYQEMTRNLISEKPLKEVIETMTQYVDKSVSNAKNVAARLVMTESAYFASEGQKSCFKDLGVEEYEIVATLDDKTSDICQNMDGRHFKISEYKVGETAPPFHVWCRSTTAPYFNDEFTLTERASRDKNSNTYYIPSNIKYNDWKEIFSKEPTQSYNDITEYWRGIFGGTEERQEYKGYTVNNFNVLQDHTEYEKEIAKKLAKDYDMDVELLPRIIADDSVNTADYLINGVEYDLKEIKENAISRDNAVLNAIQKHFKQANNFIIEFSKSIFSYDEILEQCKKLFTRKGANELNRIIIIDRNGNVKNVLERMKKIDPS